MDLSRLLPWKRAPKESHWKERGVAAFSASGGTVRTSKWFGYVPRNPTFSIAANFVATNWEEAPFVVERLSRGGEWERDEGHGASMWPLVADVRGGLWRRSVVDYMAFGNVYWLMGSRGGAPACVRLDPARVTVVPGADGLVAGYEYTASSGERSSLETAQVAHFRHGADPSNPLVGESPLAGLVREVMQDNMAGAYGLGLMMHYGVVGATFHAEPGTPPLDPDAQRAFKDAVHEAFTLEGAGSALVVPPGYSVSYPAKSPDSLDLGALHNVPMTRILAALGLSPMALGLPDPNKTYSNYVESRDAAWEQCIIPIKRVFADGMTKVWSDGTWRYTLDMTTVRAMAQDTATVERSVAELYAAGVIDRAEARARVGEEVKPEDVGVYATDIPGLGAKALMDKMRQAQQARAHLQDG